MRIPLLTCSLVVALLGALTAGSALAQDKGGARAGAKKAATPAATTDVKFGFAAQDRAIIAAYYPPRASKGRDQTLPVGVEAQLQRNEKLTPALQNRIQPLPAALERQLPGLPLAYRRGILDTHLLVYMPGTKTIVDVMLNAVR